MSGGKLTDFAVERLSFVVGVFDNIVVQIQVKHLLFYSSTALNFKQLLDLRTKQEIIIQCTVEKGFFPKSVTRAKKFVCCFIVKREGKHPVEARHTLFSPHMVSGK